MKKNYGPYYSFPLSFWMVLFFVLPTLLIFVYAFFKKAPQGGVIFEFSLEAFKVIFNPTVLKIAWMTLYISVAATVFTLFLALPAAYFIARSRHKDTLLLLVVIPFWINFLIRIYAWIAILGNSGFLNSLLLKIGLTESPVQFLYNSPAVVLITVYTYLPYAILPLYASIEKFDFSLLEAARDLGAGKTQSLIKVFLPGIRSGIITSALFTLIPALGSYVIPQLVGGTNIMLLGNVIAREITVTRNWPLASAMSMILSLITMVGIVIFMKRQGREKIPVTGG